MKKLICIGDSLTFGLGVRVSQKWTHLAARASGWQVTNLGVNGDTTGGMLARLQPLLADPALRDPTAERPRVLIMGGSNDIFYSGSDVCARANMGAMLHQLMGAGIAPIVGIPIPFDPAHAPARWADIANYTAASPMLEVYCSWLERYCQAFGVDYVNFRADFLTPEGQLRRELLADGLHPNGEGHQIMANRLCAEVLT